MDVELREKNQLNNVLHEIQLKQLATSFFSFSCNKRQCAATVEDFHHNRTRIDGGSGNIENLRTRELLTDARVWFLGNFVFELQREPSPRISAKNDVHALLDSATAFEYVNGNISNSFSSFFSCYSHKTLPFNNFIMTLDNEENSKNNFSKFD